MLKAQNKEAAFEAIADDLELPLVLLSNPDPRVRLVQLEKIGAALASANLTWRDFTERVVALRPAEASVKPSNVPPPEWDMSAVAPKRSDAPDAFTVMTNEQLKAFGYRSRGPGYGYEGTPIPEPDTPRFAQGGWMAQATASGLTGG